MSGSRKRVTRKHFLFIFNKLSEPFFHKLLFLNELKNMARLLLYLLHNKNKKKAVTQ